MSEKRKLVIDTMICDFRNVTEEVLRQYESVHVKAMMVYVTDSSLELLTRYRVQMDAMMVEKIGENVKIVENNGLCKISACRQGNEKMYLMSNGKLVIEKGAEEALKNYVKILVNGMVVYPDGLSDTLAPILTCNGSAVVYPDDAVLVEKALEVDRIFAARAEEGKKYFVTGKVYFTDPDTDYEKLAEKHVHIETAKAVVFEKNLNAAVQILNDSAEILLVPDGCSCVRDSARLDENFVLRHGTRIFVDGDLEVKEGKALNKLEFLQVTGRAVMEEKDQTDFLNVCKKYDQLETYRGKLIQDVSNLRIDRAMLEAAGQTLSVMDCAAVEIAADVTKEGIEGRLFLSDCASVSCPVELMGIVKLQAKDVANFRISGEAEKQEEQKDTDVIHIETMKYTM